MARTRNRGNSARRVQRRLGEADRQECGATTLREIKVASRYMTVMIGNELPELRDFRIALRRKLNGDTR